MPVKWTKTFAKSYEDILKKYPKSKEEIEKFIDTIDVKFEMADIYPGIVPEVRKLRIALRSYNIGKSAGVRLICAKFSKIYIPIFIYKKGQFKKESDVINYVKNALRSLIVELR